LQTVFESEIHRKSRDSRESTGIKTKRRKVTGKSTSKRLKSGTEPRDLQRVRHLCPLVGPHLGEDRDLPKELLAAGALSLDALHDRVAVPASTSNLSKKAYTCRSVLRVITSNTAERHGKFPCFSAVFVEFLNDQMMTTHQVMRGHHQVAGALA
jgi:hypothetical protein